MPDQEPAGTIQRPTGEKYEPMSYVTVPATDRAGNQLPEGVAADAGYEGWLKADLQSALDTRGLTADGTTNADMIAALEADDATRGEAL